MSHPGNPCKQYLTRSPDQRASECRLILDLFSGGAEAPNILSGGGSLINAETRSAGSLLSP